MSSLLIFFISLIICCYGDSGNIITGPVNFIVGRNLDVWNYPQGTAWDIQDTMTSDDTARIIQQAIMNVGYYGGGTVYIKAGTYLINKNLFIYDNFMHIKGDGIDRTIIKLDDYAPSFIVGSSRKTGLLRTELKTNLLISNLTLDGNKLNQNNDLDSIYGRYGIFTEGCKHIWIDNVKVINFQGNGIDLHGWKNNTLNLWGNHVTISNSIAENNDKDGFVIDQSLNVTINNCIANNNSRHGFNIVTGSKYISLFNNSALNNGYRLINSSGCGFMIQNNQLLGTSDIELFQNNGFKNKKSGLCLDDVFNIMVRNNSISNTCTCFNLIETESTQIYNNNCFTNKFIKATSTTIINSSGSDQFVHVYNNTFNQSSC